jgi:cyclopropane fatty-acyl-phospholipid synthase-like methyltransferase
MRTSTALAAAVVVATTLAVGLRAQHPSPTPGQKPDHMEHKFDPATSAKSFDDPARDAWQMPDRVIAALGIKPGQSVADIGAGTGYFSTRLAKVAAAPTVYAVDLEPAMVKHLEQRAAKEGLKNIVPVQASTDSPNLRAPVDTILIVDTYHHIGQRVDYFRRLKASIKPGGQLAIIDFRKDSPDGPPVEFRFTPEQISGELAQAGFTLETGHDFLPRQLFLVFRVARGSR